MQEPISSLRMSKARRRRSSGWRLLLLCGTLGIAALPAVGFGNGVGETSLVPVSGCEALAGREIAHTLVTAARRVAAAYTLPGHCAVSATEIGTEHDMKAILPDQWSRRLYQLGGGGFDGEIRDLLPPAPSARNAGPAPLQSGAMVLGNNGGHRDPTGLALLNNPKTIERYAHTAIGITRDFGEALAVTYYGEAPRYAYYQGCSNGGRGALNAAAKYGSRFDAVIAGAASMNTSAQVAQWIRAAELSVTDKRVLAAVEQAAVRACDALDGLVDGVIGNWSTCRFDPTADVPASADLSPASATAIKALMGGLRREDGSILYTGFGFGSLADYVSGYPLLRRVYGGYVVLGEADWKPETFDVKRDYPFLARVLEDRYHFSPEQRGLTEFLKAGKKIVLWHGSNDVVTSHRDTIRTWQQLVAATGTAAAENSRLYIAAGVNHCAGGPGADAVDLFTPTMNWVERGIPPGNLMATKDDVVIGKPAFTRPLCVHPGFPRYKGAGDVSDAASFTCW